MKGDLLLLIHGTKSGEKREKKEKKVTSCLRERPPTTFTVRFDIINETFIFFLSPRTFVGVFFLTTRRSAHDFLPFLLRVQIKREET
jgi:hypothetical protein